MEEKKSGRKIVLTAVISAAAASLVSGGLFMYTANKYQTDRQEMKEYFEVKDYIEKYYYKDTDEQLLKDCALKGLVAGLGDEYASYMTPEEYNSTMSNLSGSFAGIGVTVTNEDQKNFKIIDVIEDSPAKSAGMQVDDIIIGVDDMDVTSIEFSELVELIQGEIGTEVTVTVKRGDKKISFTMARQKIDNETVNYKMIDGILYIKISSFKESTVKHFEEALDYGKSEKAKGIIYDLRDNGGGLLTACEDMLDPLLPEGDVAYAEYKNDKSEVICTSDDDEINIPSVILVNGNSASASELFASAMRDFEKAILVGEKTFGKGIMQTTIKLSNDGGLRFTTAEYRTAKSECFHGVGIIPDFEVSLPEGTIISGVDPENDAQLKKALEILK